MRLLRLILTCVLALVSGCKASNLPRFGSVWNPEREKRGIHLVPSEAILRNPGDATGEHWILKAQSEGVPRWGGKEVEVSNSKVARETDVFYGPRYNDPEYGGPLEAVLRIRFDYEKDAAGQSPWSVSLKDGVDPMGRNVTLDEAKRILGTWGLSY